LNLYLKPLSIIAYEGTCQPARKKPSNGKLEALLTWVMKISFKLVVNLMGWIVLSLRRRPP